MHPSEALSPRDVFGARFTAAVLDLALVALAAGPLPGASGWIFALGFSFVYLGIVQGITGWSLAKAMLGARVVKMGTTTAAAASATSSGARRSSALRPSRGRASWPRSATSR